MPIKYINKNTISTTSTSLGSFVGRSASEASGWRGITYGNGLFVATAYSSGTNRVMTSPNGITWTSRSDALNPQYGSDNWFSVTYGNGLFVAVSSTSGGSSGKVMTSSDGITWTTRNANPVANTWYSVTYGNGLFVAVAGSGTNRVMTSTDGITWTARSAAENNTWRDVTYGGGLFVALAQDGTNRVMTSTDGITWTARSAAEANSWQKISYGNGMFVAVASDGTNRIMSSTDGITWTSRSAPEQTQWVNITYASGSFVGIAQSGTNRVMTADLTTNVLVSGGMKFINRNNNTSNRRMGFIIPPGPVVYSPTQRAIFGYGEAGSYQSITNLVSNTGVLANDVAGVGTARAYLGAAGYGGDKAIFAYGVVAGTTNIKNLVSNTGVVAADSSGVGTSRNKLGAVSYGIDKAIFGYGSTVYGTPSSSERVSMTNLVSNTGVVATDTTGVGSSRYNLAATGYGGDKAMFVYGQLDGNNNGLLTVNLVSNTGVVASDTSAAAGTAKTQGAGANYGGDKGIIGFGISGGSYTRETNLVSNTGVIASNTANYYGYIGGVNDVLERGWLAAAGYGGDKAIFGFGALNASRYSYTNLVSNTGVVASNTYNSNPTARYGLAAAGYSLT